MVSAAAFHRSFITAFLRACAAFAVIIAFSVCTAAAGAFNVPFSYYADHQDLSSVLMNFARTQGYGASVTEKVRGTVSGRFQDVDPMTFLGGMESAFDINWYVLGSTVYFYHSSEAQKTLLSPRAGSAQQMLAALRSSAVFSPQLPPKLSAGGDVIAVSGPPDYLDQIRMAAAAFENSLAEQTVMRVFPLKYAWAEDITVSSMDKTITVPGIASILRAMVTGAPVSPARVTQERASVEKLGGKGLASVGSETQSLAPTPSPYASPATSMSGIMADPRVNAVIISDASYRMPFYEQVIRDLDKPVELVEIHAAIVDIDTDFKRDLGFTWQGGKQTSSGTGWSFGGTVTGSKESGTGFPSAAGIIDSAGMTLSTIYTHGADFFLSRIQALEANNEARVLGRPSVLTVDNIQATLENTTTYYVEVQGYQAVDLYKVEAGTVLRVTPHIIRENGETSIKLAVSVQDDQDSSNQASTSSGVPPIKQTKINTQAVVGAGQSLLIGGYYYEQKDNTESGVPLLKDIPVLGHAFKTTAKKSKRMERLILITPRIVNLNERNVPVHAEHPAMHRAATQADYEAREPLRPASPKPGCASSGQVQESPSGVSDRQPL